MEENSVNKSVVIFLLSICVISLALGIFANYRLIVISRENQQQKEKKKDNNKNIVQGVEEVTDVTDEATLEFVKKRQIVLKNYTTDQLTFKKSRIYEKDQSNKDLSEEGKLLSVLYTLYENDKNYEELDKNMYPNITPNRDGATYVLNPDVVRELYTNTYGGELDVNTSIPEEVKRNFYYNKEYNVYVINTGFGGNCADGSLTYDYKFMEDSANVYVYSAHVYYKNCPYEVYKDFDKKEKYEAGESLEINESNYQDFYNYKVTYKKDGSNYVFEAIEKIK